MKRFAIALLMLFSCAAAHASIPLPVTPIGNAYNDGAWYSTTSSTLGAGSRGGWSTGFNLAQDYYIDSIEMFIKSSGDVAAKSAQVTFSLVSGTVYSRDNAPLPNSKNVLFRSQAFDVPVDSAAHGYKDFAGLHLTAGDYWLWAEGYAPPPSWTKVEGYELTGLTAEEFAQVHNPEPATMLMMMGGLAGAWRMRRKAS